VAQDCSLKTTLSAWTPFFPQMLRRRHKARLAFMAASAAAKHHAGNYWLYHGQYHCHCTGTHPERRLQVLEEPLVILSMAVRFVAAISLQCSAVLLQRGAGWGGSGSARGNG